MSSRPLPDPFGDSIPRLRAAAWGRGFHPSAAEATEAVRLLNEIAAAGDPALVPALLAFLDHPHPTVALAAGEAIHELVTGCPPLELARLDVAIREVSEWRHPPVKATDIPRLSYGRTGILGALASNGSGYVREAAVSLLAGERDGGELPFLLIRLNDWVRPVREAARRAVLDRVVPAYAPHFIHALPLVFRLRDQGRENHSAVCDSILGLLRRPGCRDALRAGLAAPDRHTRRAAFNLLADAGDEGQIDWLHDTLGGSDAVLRLRAARLLRTRLEGEALRTVLDRLGRDRFMPVRREALYGYVEKLPESAPALLRAALLDPHAGMREAARYYLWQLSPEKSHRPGGPAEFAAFYRERLRDADEGHLPAAVAGLGETGSAEDAARLVPFLLHPAGRVRKAAVAAVGRLDVERFIEYLLAALQDEAAGVSAAARNVLQARPYLLKPDRLWAAFQAGGEVHVRRVVLSLVARLTWWDSARILVEAAGSADEAARELALGHLQRWRKNVNRLSAPVSREQLALLKDAMDRHEGRLDEPMRQELRAVMDFAGRELA